MTLKLVWEEYRRDQPDGYSYSRFCHHFQQWKRQQNLVLCQNHRPGEKMFVDWAGAPMKIHDPRTGAIRDVSVFLAVLGASSYTYAEATHTQQMDDWIGAHTRALEFFGGATELVVPDHPKTAVTRACRYDPDVNPTYQQWALHYGVGGQANRLKTERSTESTTGVGARKGIVSYLYQMSDDGKSALVEFVSMDREGLREILESKVAGVVAFEQGRHAKAEVEAAFKAKKRDFDFSQFVNKVR